jgi:transposase
MKAREDKYAAISDMLRRGISYTDIKDALKVSFSTIAKVKHALDSNASLPTVQFPGRPTKLSPSVLTMIRAQTMANPWLSGRGLSSAIATELGAPISRQTVNRVRHSMHFAYTTPRKRPQLSPANIQKRLAFCEKVLGIPNSIDWASDVVISDESRFGLFEDSRRMWILRGVYNPETFRTCAKFAQSVMVWGAISLGYKSPLIFIKGTLNASRYEAMLRTNHILEDIKSKCIGREMWFQQDGAPAHRAKSTIQFIKQTTRLVEDWPPNSPDLSVIENVWGILKNKVAARAPKTIEQLKSCLTDEWNALDQSTLDGLIRSIPERCRLCLEHHGDCISLFTKRHSPLGNAASPPDGVLTVRALQPKHIDCVVRLRGIITRFRQFSVGREKFLRLQDEPAFTPAGSAPRSIMLIAAPEAEVPVLGDAVTIEGQAVLTPSRTVCVPQRAFRSAGTTRGSSLTMAIQFHRIVEDGYRPRQEEPVNAS